MQAFAVSKSRSTHRTQKGSLDNAQECGRRTPDKRAGTETRQQSLEGNKERTGSQTQRVPQCSQKRKKQTKYSSSLGIRENCQ